MSKQRTPTVAKVFEAFIAELRTDPHIDDTLCDRLEDILKSGQTITSDNLKKALFPKEEVDQA